MTAMDFNMQAIYRLKKLEYTPSKYLAYPLLDSSLLNFGHGKKIQKNVPPLPASPILAQARYNAAGRRPDCTTD